MKTIGKFLILFLVMFVSGVTMAQNTGTTPFEGSTHSYHVDKSTLTTSLTWSVVGGSASDYEFIGGNTGEDVQVKWKTASATPYTLVVEEKRTDITQACATTRQIEVTVGTNSFDVYADVVTTADACATVSNPVVDVNNDGENSNDVFGTTTREFLVTAADATGNWNFTYTLTHGGEAVGDLQVDGVDYDASYATGKTISGIGTATRTITVTYTTNKDRQDQDFDLVLTVTGATDSLGTTDGDGSGNTNDATYNVRAMPATTGITVTD